ncbi:EAL domain-containing protein [Sphingorhabdus sp.]|uniref:EAL domain-containing protein n=1 Tax=Sphingorhabdus sp. TaxID=1902408 RepID=UPI003919A27C
MSAKSASGLPGSISLPVQGTRRFFDRWTSQKGDARGDSDAFGSPDEAFLLLRNFEASGRGWFWSTDSKGCVTYLSAPVIALLNKNPEEIIGQPFLNLFQDVEHDESQRTLPFILTKHSKFDDLPVQAASTGAEIWWSVSGEPFRDSAGNFAGFRGSGTDITKMRRSAESNSKLATYDSLTGLLNRFRMSKLLETMLPAFQLQKRSCALILVDLDRFKQVNDTLGHPAGDALLKQVADRLVKTIGPNEKISRLGGDEFQIFLPDVEDRGTLGDLAERIIRALSQPYSVDGCRCIIGASVGIAVSPFDGQTSEDLIRNADLALYAAKAGGRGRFRFFSSDLLQAAEDRRILEEDLRDALAKNQMWLAYQPVVDSNTNIVSGFEALLRWSHPDRGSIPPSLFIPIAEDANLIGALGEWALTRACEEATKWPGKLKVAVNISPSQFATSNFPKIVENALFTSGLPPIQLELEITEGVFLQESADTDSIFAALKKIGVRLALDDFGTGYSSLGYLKTAPFDKIKIDQSFVRGATDPASRNGAIIAAIVALADALDLETTAEGIETLDQLELVRSLRVTHVQGYVYSQPVSNEVLLERCAAGEWIIQPAGPPVQRSDRFSMYRKIAAIHDNHRYAVVLRNISVSGALIEGIYDVPIGTKFVLDFGDGQLAVSTVMRSAGCQQGVAFEERLVSDGNGGLCTSRRVSPYMLAAASQSVTPMSQGQYASVGNKLPAGVPAFSTVYDWKSG